MQGGYDYRYYAVTVVYDLFKRNFNTRIHTLVNYVDMLALLHDFRVHFIGKFMNVDFKGFSVVC